MNTKTKRAVDLFNRGCFKESLAIFRTFKIGFTKEQKRVIQIASESLSGNSQFYLKLGIDVQKLIDESKSIISAKYSDYGRV